MVLYCNYVDLGEFLASAEALPPKKFGGKPRPVQVFIQSSRFTERGEYRGRWIVELYRLGRDGSLHVFKKLCDEGEDQAREYVEHIRAHHREHGYTRIRLVGGLISTSPALFGYKPIEKATDAAADNPPPAANPSGEEGQTPPAG